MFATVDHIEQLRSDTWTFWLKPEKPYRFIAGQYAELYVPHTNADDRGEHRWLTISSTPKDDLLALTTRFELKPSTYKQALKLVQPGQRLYLSEPLGDFVLPKMHTVPVVLVAAGIGITPMQSMISDMIQKQEQRPITLIHIGRTTQDLFFTSTFETANISYYQLLTRPDANWHGLQGQMHGSRVLEIAGVATPLTLFYLSGPEKLVMQLHDELITLGIDREQIVLDYFPGYVQL